MEEATFAHLMYGTVHGSLNLTPLHMRRLIKKYVGLAKPHLRNVSLPTIGDQIIEVRLPSDFKYHRALKVYSVGAEPWTDVDMIEYWFVDRDGRWYWVKCDPQGGRADCSTVTAQHLINQRTNNGRIPVRVLSEICEAFQQKFVETAERAQNLSNDLTKAAAALAKGSSINSIIPPSAP
jgi:hypothetical protein